MIELDDGQTQEAFLIEMRSVSGHSGSPVMWIYPPYHPRATLHNVTTMDMKHTFDGPWLLGVDCGSFPFYGPVYKVRKEEGETIRTRQPDLEAKSHAGMAAVIPAWKLTELLNLEEFVMARKKEDERLSETKDGGRFDRDVAEDKPLTREGFDDVLKQVSRKTTDSASRPESRKTRTSE